MTDLSYRCRPSMLGSEVTWTLSSSALEVSSGRRVPFAEIAAIRLYGIATSVAGPGRVPAATRRCVIKPVHGRAIVLTSSHFLSLGRFEDRSAAYAPFVKALLERVRAAQPAARLLRGMPPALWWLWCALGVGSALVGAFGVTILVVELWSKGHVSLEVLVLLPMVAGMLFSARAILHLLRSGRSRPLDSE